jgi:hypothetical protein
MGLSWVTGWWFRTRFIFHHIWDVILPIDFYIFQRGRYTTDEVISGAIYGDWTLQNTGKE